MDSIYVYFFKIHIKKQMFLNTIEKFVQKRAQIILFEKKHNTNRSHLKRTHFVNMLQIPFLSHNGILNTVAVSTLVETTRCFF